VKHTSLFFADENGRPVRFRYPVGKVADPVSACRLYETWYHCDEIWRYAARSMRPPPRVRHLSGFYLMLHEARQKGWV
jgi:hypothetical protein